MDGSIVLALTFYAYLWLGKHELAVILVGGFWEPRPQSCCLMKAGGLWGAGWPDFGWLVFWWVQP
ncbi:MAG: hypothetical protein IPL28_15405, partial [Chloroflexi bacterium]|nr:hypothetical protein [Chloroflexota bacterium]